MKKYHITAPHIESLASVSKALNEYAPGFDSNLCVFKDSSALVDWFRNPDLPGRSFFFNSSGYRIITQDSAFCSGVETEFAKNLNSGLVCRLDSHLRFDMLKKNLKQVGSKACLDPFGYDYTCVIFWAKFMGKMNKSTFAIAEAALHSQSGLDGKVNCIFLCMDIMDFWGASENMIHTSSGLR